MYIRGYEIECFRRNMRTETFLEAFIDLIAQNDFKGATDL